MLIFAEFRGEEPKFMDFRYTKELDIWCFVGILQCFKDTSRILVLDKEGEEVYAWSSGKEE